MDSSISAWSVGNDVDIHHVHPLTSYFLLLTSNSRMTSRVDHRAYLFTRMLRFLAKCRGVQISKSEHHDIQTYSALRITRPMMVSEVSHVRC